MEHATDYEQVRNKTAVIARTEKAPWGEALLAGLLHLLYPLAVYGYQLPLQSYRAANGYLLHASNLVFWGIVLLGLIFAWGAGWRRWSATWIGYGLVLLTELMLVLPTSGMAISEGLAIFSGILWILLTVGFLAWTARRDWLDGFLAVLPLFPMWYSYLALDGVAGNEAPLFYAIGLFMAVLVGWTVRQGNPLRGLGWILTALIVVGLAVSYATIYFSNIRPPVGLPPAPTAGAVASALVLFLLGYIVLSCPVWVTAIVRWRRQQRN